MENKAKYTVVGLFVLLFTIAMVVFILWLARYDIEKSKALEYRLYSKTSIAGLNKNSIVEYKGLGVGTVDEIRIDPKNLEQVEVVLKITNPEIIKVDSFAIVQSQGVTGNKLIEIDGGTQEAKPLLPDNKGYAIIPLKKSFIDKLTSSADNISSKIESVLKRFELLLNEKNINSIENILSNTDDSSKNFNEMILKVNNLIEKDLKNTLKNVNSMTTSIDNVVKKDVSNAVKEINSLSKNFNKTSDEINLVLKEDVKQLINDLRVTAKSSQNIDKVISDLEQTLEKIDITIEEFNSSGGNMLFQTRQNNYGPGEQQ